jgi:hypothetical protein
MLRHVCLALGLAIFCGGTARAVGDPSDEILKQFFPDRDLKAAVKIVNHADGIYGVADAAEILPDGRIVCRNAALVQVNRRSNEPATCSMARGGRLVLKLKKPVMELADLIGNGLDSAEFGN